MYLLWIGISRNSCKSLYLGNGGKGNSNSAPEHSPVNPVGLIAGLLVAKFLFMTTYNQMISLILVH
jgi:hypothetical protein